MKNNDKKIKILILKTLFSGKKNKKITVDAHSFSHEISKKQFLSLKEIENILNKMQADNLIEFVANRTENDYNYIIKLKPKGEYFLSSEQSKGNDFIVGMFVYIIFFGLVLLLVFVIKNLFGGDK